MQGADIQRWVRTNMFGYSAGLSTFAETPRESGEHSLKVLEFENDRIHHLLLGQLQEGRHQEMRLKLTRRAERNTGVWRLASGVFS